MYIKNLVRFFSLGRRSLLVFINSILGRVFTWTMFHQLLMLVTGLWKGICVCEEINILSIDKSLVSNSVKGINFLWNNKLWPVLTFRQYQSWLPGVVLYVWCYIWQNFCISFLGILSKEDWKRGSILSLCLQVERSQPETETTRRSWVYSTVDSLKT